MSDAATRQRQNALQQANRVRTVRAEVKAALRATKNREEALREAAAIIALPPDELENMRVETLLKSIYLMGGTKSTRLLNRAGIAPTKTIGGLTGRQRKVLVETIREAAS